MSVYFLRPGVSKLSPNKIKVPVNHFYFLVTVITVWFVVTIIIICYIKQLCDSQNSFHKALYCYKFPIFIFNALFDF